MNNLLAALGDCLDHPLVQELRPGIREVDLEGRSVFALEFCSGPVTAVVWQDPRGHWGAGRWRRRPRPAASPDDASVYFNGAGATPTLRAALDHLSDARSERAVEVSPKKKAWWRLW